MAYIWAKYQRYLTLILKEIELLLFNFCQLLPQGPHNQSNSSNNGDFSSEVSKNKNLEFTKLCKEVGITRFYLNKPDRTQ